MDQFAARRGTGVWGTMEGMVKGNPGLGHEFIMKGWGCRGIEKGRKVVDVSLLRKAKPKDVTGFFFFLFLEWTKS